MLRLRFKMKGFAANEQVNLENDSEESAEDEDDVLEPNAVSEVDPVIPAMDFEPGVRSRGKPKKKRQGAPTLNNRSQPAQLDLPSPLIGGSRKRVGDSAQSDQPAKKTRGRPKGAKNKQKEDKPAKLVRVTTFPPTETCCTCSFGLAFRRKVVVKCPRCAINIHEKCLKGLNGSRNCDMIPDSAI